jgi:hypothetical protein
MAEATKQLGFAWVEFMRSVETAAPHALAAVEGLTELQPEHGTFLEPLAEALKQLHGSQDMRELIEDKLRELSLGTQAGKVKAERLYTGLTTLIIPPTLAKFQEADLCYRTWKQEHLPSVAIRTQLAAEHIQNNLAAMRAKAIALEEALEKSRSQLTGTQGQRL